MKLTLYIYTTETHEYHPDTWPFVDFQRTLHLADGVELHVTDFIDTIHHFDERKQE